MEKKFEEFLSKNIPLLKAKEHLDKENKHGEPATNIFSLDDRDRKEKWYRYTDNIIAIEQGDNLVILKEDELKQLEDIIGTKFKC